MKPRNATPIYLAFADWKLSDRNLFGWRLARFLKDSGYQVEIIIGPSSESTHDARMPEPSSAGIDFVELSYTTSFRQRVLAYGSVLRSRASGILISIGDYSLSSMFAVLPDHFSCVHILHESFGEHIQRVVRVSRYIDALVVNSEYVARAFRPYRYIAPRLHIIRPFAQVAEPRQPSIDPSIPLRVVYAGPMNDWHKGTLILAPIIEASISLGADIVVRICGKCSTSYQHRLHAESFQDLMGMGRLEWVETTDPEVMEQSFLDADVLLLPSRHEGFPALLPAAMAVGCVPVVTEVKSGTPELVADGETGLVAPVEDVAGLASKIHQLCTNRTLLARLSCNARQQVWRAGCSRDFVARQLGEMLQAVEEDRFSGTVYRKSCGLIAEPQGKDATARECKPMTEAESSLARTVHGRLDKPALIAATLPPGDAALSDKAVRARLRSLKIADALRRLRSARSLVR